MLAKIFSGTVIGLDGILIEVEVDVASKGFPRFTIVGLPDKAVGEAKERVRAAIVNASFKIPDTRITVNLAPADIPKIGSAFDLPMAIGILTASGIVKKEILSDCLFIGELSLRGDVRKVPGAISIALLAKSKKIKKIFVSRENVSEVILVDGIEVYPVDRLIDLILHLNEVKLITPFPHQDFISLIKEEKYDYLFEDIKGQETAKRALEIAAAGRHHVLFIGPPGSGKTMLAERFPTICPPLTPQQRMEVANIYSLAGEMDSSLQRATAPFRAPHHSISPVGLVGGGNGQIMPGEITLAHHGVLFLDELPEFPRNALESLRQPLESGTIHIIRAGKRVRLPAQFQMITAMNPCKCGYLGHPRRACSCPPGSIFSYRRKLSGPLLDRVDIHVEVASVSEEEIFIESDSENSQSILNRVMEAYQRQQKRYEFKKQNSALKTQEILQFCSLKKESVLFLREAMQTLHLSMRSYHRILKVSRTIADLAGAESIATGHVAEALQYRCLDRESF